MQIIFHARHAPVSNTMRLRAERAVRKLARLVPRTVDAVIRFAQDGPAYRVEIALHAPRTRDLVAIGRARFPGVALADAIARLEAEVTRAKRTPSDRARRAVVRHRTLSELSATP